MADIFTEYKEPGQTVSYTMSLNIKKLSDTLDDLQSQINILQEEVNNLKSCFTSNKMRRCPQCNGVMNISEVITTIPPINVYKCSNCGYKEE